MTESTATVAYCHPGSVAGVFAESMHRLMMHDANTHQRVTKGGGVISMASGPLIAAARNQLVQAFLRHEDTEWLFMVDADMAFEANALDRLIAAAEVRGAKIMGGLCFAGRGGQVTPTMYRVLSKGDADNPGQVGIIESWPRGEVVQVDATGAACLLIHREVLTEMEARYPGVAPWFFTGIHGRTEFGEDFGFCLRAAILGFGVYVDTSVQVGHQKSHIIDLEDFDSYLEKRAAVGEEGVTAHLAAKVRSKVTVPQPNRAERRRLERATR